MCKKIDKIILTIIIIGFCAARGWTADNQLTPAEKKAGFVSIFNGSNLTGWDGDSRFWSVKDGAIRGQTTKENPTRGNTFCIWRDGNLKNFVLKIKFRIRNGNSGIQYRSQDLSNWQVSGYQAEVENKQGKVGFLYHEHGRGWMVNVGDIMVVERDKKDKVQKNVVGKIADVNELIKAGYYKNKDWNEYIITCRGNHIIHMLNGFQTIEMIDNDPKDRIMEGILALQIHAGPPMLVEFKDIRVRHLPDHFGMAKRPFNGLDLNDWTLSSEKLKDTWSVKDGLMINKGNPRGYIRTKADFTNYILRLQFRHKGKGNGGVLLRMVGRDKVWPRSIEAQGQFGSAGDIWNIDKFPMKVDQARTKGRHTVKLHKSNEKPGQWNQYEITMDRDYLELKVNELIQNTATECWKTPGKICLQSEGSPMEFRNLVLIPIH
jgi:3-keto-disaccharide hydrolase